MRLHPRKQVAESEGGRGQTKIYTSIKSDELLKKMV
jgi:hypothetical protein